MDGSESLLTRFSLGDTIVALIMDDGLLRTMDLNSGETLGILTPVYTFSFLALYFSGGLLLSLPNSNNSHINTFYFFLN